MRPLVVDASVAASWLFDDEDNAQATVVLDRLGEAKAIVPQLWHFEMRNVLLVACRRQRISPQGLRERVAALGDLPLQTDLEPDLAAALFQAETHGLSYYDGLYLELACRLQAVMATLDKALLAAARAQNLPVIQDR